MRISREMKSWGEGVSYSVGIEVTTEELGIPITPANVVTTAQTLSTTLDEILRWELHKSITKGQDKNEDHSSSSESISSGDTGGIPSS